MNETSGKGMIEVMILRIALAALLALTAFAQGRFEKLATYRGLGALVATTVGPGPTDGSQRLYLSYLYINNTIEVVAVNPDTGEFQVFPNPAAGESGARCITVGPDGKIYLGTLPAAHFLQLNPKAGTLVDLGRPSATEQYIWDVAFANDGKLYGATYPQSKLVRYDPATGKLEDLGRMDPVEQYAHFVAGDNDGFVYVGIGTSKANIAAYEIATGRHQEILPSAFQTVGQASVYRALDGAVYGVLGPQRFRLKGWTATPIASKDASPAEPHNLLADGRAVAADDRTIRVANPATKETVERRFEYPGNALPVFRVNFAPDGVLYGSAVLPIHFLKLDSQAGALSELGDLGGGEIYSFLPHGNWLLMAGYGSVAPLMKFDPAQPFFQGSGDKNPLLVNYPGSDSGWRPQALIDGPDGRVYIGSVAGYGKLVGPLTVWNPDTDAIENYPQLVTDQSVVSLAAWQDLIVGGTTTGGGGGSHPTQTEAKIFLWDPAKRQKLWEAVPQGGAGSVTDLTTAPNGLVYGIAGRVMFVFDPQAREIRERRALPFSGAIYNSVDLGPDGRLWGLASTGIFTIDPATNDIALVARSPEPITAGFAIDDQAIYYVSGTSVWRYVMAPPVDGATTRKPLPVRRPGKRAAPR